MCKTILSVQYDSLSKDRQGYDVFKSLKGSKVIHSVRSNETKQKLKKKKIGLKTWKKFMNEFMPNV